MSLLGLRRMPPAAPAPRVEHTPASSPDGAGSGQGGLGHVLVYNPPDAPAPGYRRGWTLAARPAGPRDWSTSLAGHGAGLHTGPRVAKAVAVRVLAERGVAVDGWADHPDVEGRGLVMFTTRAPHEHQPASAAHTAATASRLPSARVDPGLPGGPPAAPDAPPADTQSAARSGRRRETTGKD